MTDIVNNSTLPDNQVAQKAAEIQNITEEKANSILMNTVDTSLDRIEKLKEELISLHKDSTLHISHSFSPGEHPSNNPEMKSQLLEVDTRVKDILSHIDESFIPMLNSLKKTGHGIPEIEEKLLMANNLESSLVSYSENIKATKEFFIEKGYLSRSK